MNETPLYAIFQDGEWYFVDEEIWADLVDQVIEGESDE